MVDRVAPEKRSEIMRAVPSKHSRPELLVRSAAHRLGLRFRLHAKQLPGTPDLVLPRWKTVVFVNGCYWHQHRNCPKAQPPKSNKEFWSNKFKTNVARDLRNYAQLEAMGWKVVIIWQCQITTLEQTMKLLRRKFRTQGAH
ncbi:very short patch repair endonuclease [Dyella sedimenti]|uniref:very short patch repair endonuclease n=1 Tax=Dyella sedimenti TaxID=2919947 RepID=UPI002432A2E0|nr:very short patch repair endonuclease [Dyella sedimenti]